SRIQDKLLSSLDGFSELMNSIGNKKRIYILALLLDSPKLLSVIEERTELGKTALAHHINLLLNASLIKRISRGEYEITADGIQILKDNLDLYLSSGLRSQEKAKQLQERFFTAYKLSSMRTIDEKVVSNKPSYQLHPITYIGAITGALQSLGCTVTVDELAGFLGYGFLLSVSKDDFMLGAITGHTLWSTFASLISKFGWKVKSYIEEEPLPSDHEHNQPLSIRDDLRAKKIFDKIQKEIDKDKPVVLWGIPVPEFCIVSGYRNNGYVASTYAQLEEDLQNQFPYDKLDAEGTVHLIMFDKPSGDEIKDKDYKESIERAIYISENKNLGREGYITGIKAYDEWIDRLEKGEDEGTEYFANAYMIESFSGGRKSVVEYLKMLVERFSGSPQSIPLQKAADEYNIVSENYAKLHELFPRVFEGFFTEEKCKKGASLLRTIKEHEEEAIYFLKRANKNWKK
ncbi:MAG: winged helix-turn-helix domain-containing protein, partial [Candidatus Heimdallarchaeota archaeon]